MKQTELQKQFERETGCSALYSEYDELLQKSVWYANKQYSDWLEAKAAAYDRLVMKRVIESLLTEAKIDEILSTCSKLANAGYRVKDIQLKLSELEVK